MVKSVIISHEPLLGVDPGRTQLGDAVAYTALWALSRCALAIPRGIDPLSQKQKDILFNGDAEQALAFEEFRKQIVDDTESAERIYICAELNNLRECFILVDRLKAMDKLVFVITSPRVGGAKVEFAQKHGAGIIWALDSIEKNAGDLFFELSNTQPTSGLA